MEEQNPNNPNICSSCAASLNTAHFSAPAAPTSETINVSHSNSDKQATTDNPPASS
jgi:hypothetical protein